MAQSEKFRELIAATENFQPPQSESFDANLIRWAEPLLFGETTLPDLKPDFLPDWLQNEVRDLSASTQTPVSLPLMVVLPTVAVCVQRKFEVSPFGDDYSEPLNLWTVSVKPPATGKSPVLNALTEPLVDWESQKAIELKVEIEKQTAKNRIIARRIEELEKQAAKLDDATDRDLLVKEIGKLQDEISLSIKIPRVWTSDATPERMAGLLAENDESLAALSSEGGIFEVMSGLYTNGKANVDVFLKAHSGDPVRVDRQGKAACLRRPALSFGLTVQPDVLADLGRGSKRRFRGNGCLARFLYDLTPGNVGTRDFSRRVGMPEITSTRYRNLLSSLLDIPLTVDAFGKLAPRKITLSPDARKMWLEFSAIVEKQQIKGARFESIADWSGKLSGQALRIAGIAHVAEVGLKAADAPISAKLMQGVLNFCAALAAHAEKAFEMISGSSDLADARFVLELFSVVVETDENGFAFVRQSAIQASSRFKNSKLERTTNALEALKERALTTGPIRVSKTGRPSIRWYLNPALGFGTSEETVS